MADLRTGPLLDDFNRAAENPLSGGGNWAGINSNLKIIAPTRVQHSTGSGLLNVQYSYWTPRTYSAGGGQEVEVWAYPGGVHSTQEGWSLGLLSSISPASGYLARWSEEIGNNAVQIRKWTAGSNTTIKDDRTFANLMPNNAGYPNDVLMFRTNGGDVELWYSGDAGATWTKRAFATDSTYRSGLRLVLGLDGSPEWRGFGGGFPTFRPQIYRRIRN